MKVDGLTNLPTHEAVAEMLSDGSTPFGVIFDIDGLVWATDSFGFAHSDAILIRVAALVDEATQEMLGGRAFRINGDEFLAVLPSASHDQAIAFASSVIRGVAGLHLAYARRDAPDRRQVALNAVVSRIAASLTANVHAVREWTADLIWQAKNRDKHRVEVVADTADSLPPWAA
jgi:GGDEF domain-containing protein